MEKQKIFEMYEKLYFHEVEAKEKISSRLQIPLAILLSITGVFAHIIKGISLGNYCIWNLIFGLIFCSSLVLFVISMSYFIRSFYGHTYEFIPSALETESYRKELLETYKEYENGASIAEEYFDEYIYKYYNECSSKNTTVNDKRSEFLHKCNTYLILSALPLAVAFLIFTLTGIDKNSVDKEYNVKITNLVGMDKNAFPIRIDGEIRTNILTTRDFKEIVHEQDKTATATTSASEKNSQRGRESDKANTENR